MRRRGQGCGEGWWEGRDEMERERGVVVGRAQFVSAVLAAEDNSCLAFSTVGEGGALGIQVGGGWVRPISVRFGMGRD